MATQVSAAAAEPRRRWLDAARSVLAALVMTAVGGAGAAAGPVTSSTGDAGPTAVPIEQLERTFANQLDEAGVPGGAVALVSAGHVDARGVGSAGGDRGVTADTPFVIGSASKSFTALAVMQLVDAGRVDVRLRDVPGACNDRAWLDAAGSAATCGTTSEVQPGAAENLRNSRLDARVSHYIRDTR